MILSGGDERSMETVCKMRSSRDADEKPGRLYPSSDGFPSVIRRYHALKTVLIVIGSALALGLFAFLPFATAANADAQSITVTGDLRIFDGDMSELGPVIIRLHGVDGKRLASPLCPKR